MAIEDSIIIKLAEYLKGIFDLTGIYLFGSVVNGNFSDESDIDVAIFIKDYNNRSLKDFAKAQFYIQNNISSRIELHFFPDQPLPLTFPDYVMNTGQKVA